MAKFQDLNERIKAALPLDPAGEQAQQFLDERDAMLRPFIALMPAEVKEAAKSVSANIDRGDLASPIDAEVHRFYREAAQARKSMKG